MNTEEKRAKHREYMRAWTKANAEKVNAANRKWRRNNLDKVKRYLERANHHNKRESVRRFYKTHPGKYAEHQRNWRRNNPERFRANQMIWRRVLSGTIVKPSACQQCGTVGRMTLPICIRAPMGAILSLHSVMVGTSESPWMK